MPPAARVFSRRHESSSSSIQPSGSVSLRPYQVTCVQSCLEALAAGFTRIGVSAPTGSGKTTIFLSLITQIPPPESRPEATRALVIVNSIELAQQTVKQTQAMFPHLSVEIEQGKHAASGVADITVATYQTMLRGFRLAKFDPTRMKAVVVDEAHHAAAPSYRQILSHFDPAISKRITSGEEGEAEPVEDDAEVEAAPPTEQSTQPVVPIIGFSATFSRHDGLALGKVFQQIVYHRDFLEMIKEQWLCDVRFTSVKAKLDLKGVTVSGLTGDFTPTSLTHVINTASINKLVVQTWLDRASERKSTLIFCVSLAHVQDLTNAFRKAGIDARLLHAGTPAVQRKKLLDDFRAGAFPVLVNCAILIEGADVPNIDCVMLTRPTRSNNLFAQMIGRGMRQSPSTGKKDCRIIDFVDSTSRVSGVVTIPTLFGLDPDDIINDESLSDLEQKAVEWNEESEPSEKNNDTVPAPLSVTYTDYDNPFELAENAAGSPVIHRLSRYGWVACGPDIYVLECLGRGHIKIEPLRDEDTGDKKGYQAWYTPPKMHTFVDKTSTVSPTPTYRRKLRVLTAQDLSAAVNGCDTYAINRVVFGPMALGLFRSAKWRSQPASTGQKVFIGKRLGSVIKNIAEVDESAATTMEARSDTLASLTKGQAANIITRLAHGAQAHYEKKIRSQARVALKLVKENEKKIQSEARVALKLNKENEKEIRRKEKYTVKVGPLSA